ncbi:MAG TPA: AsmA-like C-terminal domain-containing protein [Rhizomicrobium sp.]|nr:AsmA-like C-terminal domain-containing protein [Rhizomicrobium sp.]
MFFVVGVGIRLLVGPVSLGPLGNALPDAIARALPGIAVQYDRAAIEWSREQGRVNLVILGARVFDEEGRIVAQAPEADIGLAARPLLEGKVVVRRITLVGVQLTLVHTRDNGLRLGVEKDKKQHDILSRLSDAITLHSDKSSMLDSFAIRNARLAYFDEPTGLFVVSPNANLRIATKDANLAGYLDAAVEISGRPAHVTGEFKIPEKDGPVTGSVALKGLDLRALGANAKAFASVGRLGLVADLSASFAIDDFHLLSADFGIGAKGTLGIPGLKPGPLKVKALQLVGRYDGKAGRLLIDDASLDAGGAVAHLTGRADLVRDQTGRVSRIAFETAADKISFAMPGVMANAVSLRTISARGGYDSGTGKIVLDHLVVSGGPLSVQIHGTVGLERGASPALDLWGQMAPLSVRDLLHYWPLHVGSGAREWIADNVARGSLGTVNFETHMPAGMLDADVIPDSALKVDIPLSNVEANYLTGLTHLTQLRGTALLTGDTFSAEIQSGAIGPLNVSQGRAVITSLHIPESPGAFAAKVSGSVPDILALVNLKPLNYPARFGIDVAGTKGTAQVDLSFRVPMRKNLRVDDVGIAIKAAVTGFSIALGDHARLSDGVLDFAIDNSRLKGAGTAVLADSKLAISWDEDFKTSDPITTRITAKGMLDSGGRAALNFHSSDFLGGASGITAVLTGHRGALLNAEMTMDLTPSVLSLDMVGLNKPAGFPAEAKVDATFGPASTIKSETLRISGPGIAANGHATFDKNGHLTQLEFPAVHFGAANDFSFNLRRDGPAQQITIRGRSLDGSKLAKQGKRNDAQGGGGGAGSSMLEGPFQVSAKLDRLMLREGVNIASFTLDAAGAGDRLSTLNLSGSLSKSATISGEIAAGESGRRMTFSSGDAGLLAKGLLGFPSIRGGRIDIAGTLPGKSGEGSQKDGGGPDFQGKLVARDFKVLDQPFLARLFSAGSLGGLINLMQDKGIAVDKFEVPFTSKRGVIDVKHARATGPAIGLTADGYIDRPKNVIAMKGTLVPLFGINSVLGAIPIVGDVLVSKKGEGIFGFTYSVRGNADQPDVSVNPLSVLTPGIFRRIFEGKMPNAAQAPTNLAAPPPASPSAVPPPKS